MQYGTSGNSMLLQRMAHSGYNFDPFLAFYTYLTQLVLITVEYV